MSRLYIKPEVRQRLSTNQRKGLDARLDGHFVKADDEATAKLVLQTMLDHQLGWCTVHNDYHPTVVGYQTFEEPFTSCPPPPRYPTPALYAGHYTGEGGQGGDGQESGSGDAQSDEQGDGEGGGKGSEGEQGEPLDGETQERIEGHFEGDSDGDEKSEKAKQEAQKNGTLPKDMKQNGKDESYQKDKSKQCGVTHEKFKCTLQKGHDGDHIAHWSDGTNAKRWMGDKQQKDAYEKDTSKQCLYKLQNGYFCTKTKDHSGDHVAHVNDGKDGREVGREKQKKQPKKWRLKLFNHCPDCKIDTLNFRWQAQPEAEEDGGLLYTENPCGCATLKEIGF